MKRTLIHLLLALLLSSLGLAGNSLAAPTEDDIKKVVQLSSSAAVAYDKGEFDKALTLYRKAHSLWANPKISFAISKTLEALKKYKEALAVAKRGLTENPKAVLKARLTSKVAYLKQQLAKGRLTLLITPSGAEILIDGKLMGKAPMSTIPLDAGKHKLEIRSPNHGKVMQGITIKGGAELKLSFTLQAITGKLSITSTPSGAAVTIDGKSWGKTPLNNLNIPTGSHSVVIKYAGYKATTRRVNITAQRAQNIAVVLSQGIGGTTAPTVKKGPWYKSWPGWTFLALGVGAAGVGLYLRANSVQTQQGVTAIIQNPKASDPSQKELNDRWAASNTLQIASSVVMGSAVGLIVVAVILFATRTGSGTQSTKIKASASPQPKPKVSVLPQSTKTVQLYTTH